MAKSVPLGVACPTCRSGNVERISKSKKIGAGAMFGVFAMGTIAKTFKCRACGYRW